MRAIFEVPGFGTSGIGVSGDVRSAVKSVVESFSDKSAVKSVGDENWFSDACKRLFPKGKAGTALWTETGFRERDCQRYAAGTVKTSGWFLRLLLRGENGWTWLCVVMDAASPRWWVDLQRARRIADAMREIDAA